MPNINFPASLDNNTTLPNPGSGSFTDNPSHSNQHDNVNDTIKAIEAKVGIGVSTPSAGKVFRGTSAGVSSWGAADLTTDITGVLPLANGGTNAANAGDVRANLGLNTKLEILAVAYPVGCIYTTTSSTNPATTFGFGTWVAFGAGQVLVGTGTSDQAFAAGTTGGESTHTLTITEMPSHSHDQDYIGNLTGGGGGHQQQPLNSQATTDSTRATGGGGAHNNLQPYIVVYFWQRTA